MDCILYLCVALKQFISVQMYWIYVYFKSVSNDLVVYIKNVYFKFFHRMCGSHTIIKLIFCERKNAYIQMDKIIKGHINGYIQDNC